MIYDVQSWHYARFVKLKLVYERMNKVLEKAFPGNKVGIHPATKKDANNYENLQRECNRVTQFIVCYLAKPEGLEESHFEIGECLCEMLFDLQRLPLCLRKKSDFREGDPEKIAWEKGLILVRRPSIRYHLVTNYAGLLGDALVSKRRFATEKMMAGLDCSLRKKKAALQMFKKVVSKQNEKIRKMLRHEERNTEILFRVDKAAMKKQKAKKFLSIDPSMQYVRHCDFCEEYMETWKGCPCKIAWYCDAACQAKHWKCHRKICSFAH